MMLCKLGVFNAFSTYDIFNLPWVYQDVTPLEVEEDLCVTQPRVPSFEENFLLRKLRITLWEALVCMTEIDSKECPPHSPPQNDCTHFYHVFPKVLFWIYQLPNHKFQRLLSDYLMKSKFGNLSR